MWPEGILDACIAVICKPDGDATHLWWPLCFLPVVFRLRASARMHQLEHWFQSWVLASVFGAGGGKSLVEAWYSIALDIEEVLSGAVNHHVHLFFVDVGKSFDTGSEYLG